MQRPRKRARKSCEDGAATLGTRTVGKGRGRRTAGMLSELMSMPLDIFFEVAAHLHPLDMLNLARTSMSLRSIVLAKSSRSAWMASLATVDALPSCPANMSEPSYAALLFDRFCFLCGSAYAKWVDYAIRLRLCKACYRSNILLGSELLDEEHAEMLFLFPCETGPDYWRAKQFAFPPNRTPGNKYYVKHVMATLNQILAVDRQDREAARRLLKENLNDATEKHNTAVKILAWLTQESMLKELSDHDAMRARKLRITQRLEELGYAEDDFPRDKEAWDKLVQQPKPLTDRIWNNLRPKLEEQLALEKERRTSKAFQDRVTERLDVIMEWYDDYINEHLTEAERSLIPNHFNARKLPSLLSLAQADDAQGAVQHEAFAALTEQMLADADAYKICAKRDIANLLRCSAASAGLQDLPTDDSDILRRYCGYFECHWSCHAAVDGCPYLTYEQLHAHWREAHPNESWLLHGTTPHRYVAVKVPALWPDTVPMVGRRVLEAAGIALDTPREVLDGWVREGRLFCACEHPGMLSPGDMSWAKLLFHLLRQVDDYRERGSEMKLLGGRHNPNHVLLPSHSLDAGDGCCIKFLPAGADTAAASTRTTIDDACRAQIEARLATRPQPGAVTVCRICKGLTRKTRLQVRRRLRYMELAERPEEIVWHLRLCHGKEFERRDILFVNL